ncbi:type II secretion system F family protein [Mycolicibacterium mucogenicum]|uniref:Type II secretion system F family protein n=1 Tax=Mycolicibacterium mucogenicum DSM 44124 TaxID=1226753 RepID=A0A8H2JHS7_MYCMU|nr:type II secretion system F family protein [Mycolicibacterium mucogenicum]KAB7756782.1 membrane protein [Mycolicibacterium mucogenicum DSM 44124]QPG68937.1 type II secretion system F family protein [Mycolicibacterium mucogenicum DSM 44124]
MSPALLLALAVLVAPPVGGAGRLGHRKRLVGFGSQGGPRLLWSAAAAVAVVALVLLPVPVPVLLAGAAVAGTAGVRWRRSRHAAQRAREAQTLQGALGILVGELRAGAHPVAAFEAAAHEVDGPVAVALGEVAARARLGADVSAGLRGVAESSALSAHWHRLAVYWQLALDHGLAIAPLMRAAERDVIARERFSSRIRAGMAGARTTAAVLSGLPVLGIVLGQLIGAHPVRFLLGDGAAVLAVGVVLCCLGLLWSDRIIARAQR